MSQRKTQELDWKKLPLAWQKKSVWEIDFISILIANQIDQKGFKEADTGPVQTAHKAQQQLWPGCVTWGCWLGATGMDVLKLNYKVLRKKEKLLANTIKSPETKELMISKQAGSRAGRWAPVFANPGWSQDKSSKNQVQAPRGKQTGLRVFTDGDNWTAWGFPSTALWAHPKAGRGSAWAWLTQLQKTFCSSPGCPLPSTAHAFKAY